MMNNTDLENELEYLLLATKAEWWRWHQANPLVWHAFQKYADEMVEMGFTRASAQDVMNRARWHLEVTLGQRKVRVSADFTRFYAKYYNVLNENQFFRLRQGAVERRLAKLQDSRADVIDLDSRRRRA